ncbi:MAG: MucR family transcriptional regulator [Pseudomonadota bacterium]
MSEINQEQPSSGELLRMAATVVSAYVRNNPIETQELTNVIAKVHRSLSELGGKPAPRRLRKPAVAVKKSVTPNYLICLEDGRKMKMLKRHLRTSYSMTPAQYRAKWGLPPDYPMVAPNYAKQRSAFAKKIGLGKNGSRLAP